MSDGDTGLTAWQHAQERRSVADPHATARLDAEVYERGLRIGGIEALREQRDALAADLASVRAQLEQTREALRWIKGRADRGVADGHLMLIDAIEIANEARAALAAADPASHPARPNEHTATNLPATATVFPRPPAEREGER